MLRDEQNNEWISGAVEALDGGAIKEMNPSIIAPRRNKIGKASAPAQTDKSAPSHTKLPDATIQTRPMGPSRRASQIQEANGTPPAIKKAPPEPHSRKGRKAKWPSVTNTEAPCDNLPPAIPSSETEIHTQAAPELTGQNMTDAHSRPAGQNISDQGHGRPDTQPADALIGNLIEAHRYRWQMIRARQRLELQGQAFCRSFVDGDKVAAAKLWADCRKDGGHEFRIWLAPFMAAMEPLLVAQLQTEKKLAKMVKTLPVYDWAKSVSGFGDVSLSAVIGELGCAPTDYKSVAAIWKRMGLAVINGGRQRRVTGDAAIEHGYNSERRAIMWNIGACLLKAQVRNEKDEDGKKVEGAAFAIGDFGQLYLDHKASLVARNEAGEFSEAADNAVKSAKSKGSKPNAHNLEGKLAPSHIHNRAQRYIEKRLLRELWRAWRQATKLALTTPTAPASNLISQGE